jgi:hypothetical protein
MRFIITAQASAEKKTTEQQSDFDVELFKAYMRFNEEMHQAGILVASEGLNPSAPGARIAVANGKRYVVDGPFAESKELVGGFYLIDVTSLDEAIHWALRAPSGFGADDILEIRQLTGSGDLPPEILRLITEAAPTWSASANEGTRCFTFLRWIYRDVDLFLSRRRIHSNSRPKAPFSRVARVFALPLCALEVVSVCAGCCCATASIPRGGRGISCSHLLYM